MRQFFAIKRPNDTEINKNYKKKMKTNMKHSNKRQPLNYRLLTWDWHIPEYGGVKHTC